MLVDVVKSACGADSPSPLTDAADRNELELSPWLGELCMPFSMVLKSPKGWIADGVGLWGWWSRIATYNYLRLPIGKGSRDIHHGQPLPPFPVFTEFSIQSCPRGFGVRPVGTTS
jgi:hypothetical protein